MHCPRCVFRTLSWFPSCFPGLIFSVPSSSSRSECPRAQPRTSSLLHLHSHPLWSQPRSRLDITSVISRLPNSYLKLSLHPQTLDSYTQLLSIFSPLSKRQFSFNTSKIKFLIPPTPWQNLRSDSPPSLCQAPRPLSHTAAVKSEWDHRCRELSTVRCTVSIQDGNSCCNHRVERQD